MLSVSRIVVIHKFNSPIEKPSICVQDVVGFLKCILKVLSWGKYRRKQSATTSQLRS